MRLVLALCCLSALFIVSLIPTSASAISPIGDQTTPSANHPIFYQVLEKPRNNTAPSFGPPPNDTETEVLSKARSFTDNITDINELTRAESDAVSYLEQNPYVARVSRDGPTILVVFKSGSESFILCRLASSSALPSTRTSVIVNKTIVQGNGNLAAVQPSQGRAAVVLDPFQWNFLGDTSYNVFSYMQSRLSSYSVIGYIPNDYVTLDEVANFFLGYHVSDYPWIVQDGAVPHVSYGLFSWAGHGGYGNGVTIFAIGECLSGTGCGAPKSPTRGTALADYNAYYSHDSSSVTTGTISGDPRIWIAITSSFVMDYLYAADYPQSDSLFFAFACQGLKGTDMAQAMAASGVYTYLGWTEEVTIINPGDPSLDTFFNSLTNGKTAAQSYQDVKNALKDYDWLTGAHLYYYPGPDTTGSPWYSSGNHGDWTTNWPKIFRLVTFYSDPTSGSISADGVVESNGASQGYLIGQRVHTVANSPSGYSFSYWETSSVSVDNQNYDTYMTVSNNGWLKAHFTQVQYTITVNTSPSGLDSPTGGGTFNQGYSDPISVGNVNGYTFKYWNRDGSLYTYSQSFYYTVDGSHTFTAVFQRNQYQLTVSAGSGGTTTPSPGTYPHYAGDSISVSYSLTVSGYTFAGWSVSGASCSGGSMSNPCQFTMPSNAVTVTANFNAPGCTASIQPLSGTYSGVIVLQGTTSNCAGVAKVTYIYSTDQSNWYVIGSSSSSSNGWRFDWNTAGITYAPSVWALDVAQDASGHDLSPWSQMTGPFTIDNRPIQYSVTFAESGIPEPGVTWGATLGGTHYSTSSGTSILVSGLTGTVSYSYDSPVSGSGGMYVCSSGCTGTVSSAATLTATYTFNPGTVTITVYSDDLQYTGQDPATLTDLHGSIFNSYQNSASTTTYSFQVPVNTQVTFSVSSNPSGWSFANWWDDYGYGQASFLTFTINVGTSNHKIAVFFTQVVTYAVTFQESGIGSGVTWGVTVAGTHYTSSSSSVTVSSLSGSAGYSYDSSVPGAPGVRYVCSSGCSGSISGPTTLTANYATQVQLTMQVNPFGGGSTNPAVGSYWYGAGSPVSISASPATGFVFQSWTGAGTGSYAGPNNPQSIIMNGPITETANFNAVVTMRVSYSISGGGTGYVAPVFNYVQGGVSKQYTLTTTATGIQVDQGSNWSVTPNPLTGSTSSERWYSNQALSGTASATTVVFTFYHQYSETLSYSVSSGGSGYSAPTFTANQFGAWTPQTLTSTATGYWYDVGSSWVVSPNPLSGSTTTEQWVSSQPLSGTLTSAQTLAFSFQHQFYLTMQVNPLGAGTNTPGSGWQNAGSVVTITATANMGYVFKSWAGSGSGSFTGSANPATITMNSPIAETANFLSQITMTVSYAILGGGSGYSAPVFNYIQAGISKTYTLTPTATPISVDSGSSWSVTPNPLAGSKANEQWRSGQTLSGVASSTTLVFTFYHQYLQTLSYSITGGGSGYSAPTFSATSYGSGAAQLLTTTATGYWFDSGSSWILTNPLGGSSGSEQWATSQAASGTVTSAQALTFQYTHQYYLTTRVNPSGSGSVTPPSGWQNASATVSVTATASSGYIFVSWSGSGSGSYSGSSDPASAQMNGPITETANFQPISTITFQLGGVSSDASGTIITVDGTAYNYSQLPMNLSWVLGSKHSVSVTSLISAGTGKQYVFTSWSNGDGLVGSSGTYTTPSSPSTVTANYTTQFYLTVASPYDSPKPTGGWFDAGSSIVASVTSPASDGTGTQYLCTGWSGSGSVPANGTSTSVTFTVNSPSTITWNWKTQYSLTMQVNPSNAGTISPPSGWYDSGSALSISANANSGFAFQSWGGSGSGSFTGSTNPALVTMNGPLTETANFQPLLTLVLVSPPSPGNGTTVTSSNVVFAVQVTGSGPVQNANVTILLNALQVCQGVSNAAGSYSCSYSLPSSGAYSWYATANKTGYMNAISLLSTFTYASSPLGLAISAAYNSTSTLAFELTTNIYDNSGAGYMASHRSGSNVVFTFNDATRVSPLTHQLTFSNYGDAVLVGGRGANPTVAFYEDHAFASLTAIVNSNGTLSIIHEPDGRVALNVALSSLGPGSDYFVMESLRDGGHTVIILWGITEYGTLASGVYFDMQFPNLANLSEGSYVIHWQDSNSNGIPDPADTFMVVFNGT